jgi:hypothetical protein
MVFDSENQLMLAGFVTKINKETNNSGYKIRLDLETMVTPAQPCKIAKLSFPTNKSLKFLTPVTDDRHR